MIKLCKNCHSWVTEPRWIRQGDTFCSMNCRRMWKKYSLEEARARHYAWVREEAKTNQ